MSGWYPDPAGRFELRFHNGEVWTADVASGGRRFVDRQPIDRPPAGSNGVAVASMVCGITGLTIAWLPFVGVLGAAASVVAVVLGIIGLRRARAGAERRGFAVAGTITGALGIVATAFGVWLTVLVFQAIDEYQNPGPVVANVTECVGGSNGRVTAGGELTNGSDDERSYSVRIEISGDRGARTLRVDVDDVPAGSTREFSTTGRIPDSDEVSCRIASVDGPLPFGIEIEAD